MQFQHELTMKRLEIEQKRGLEHLATQSRKTASKWVVGGACVMIASSGAWLLSQRIAETKVNMASLQRQMYDHKANFRNLSSAGHYQKESSDQPDSKR